MARYEVRLVTEAKRRRDNLPRPARQTYDRLVRALEADPFQGEKGRDGSWTITSGGVIVSYVISKTIITVTVLRVVAI
ncbi:hypothetical protein LO772_10600 [Yinghuangia sp. ASG 101]|uniref:hypothetical protein n=1 Tax=Yinghuangia sp. ASG 101 TaxID=2896848 RepID=UPI001E58CEC8|nr:hypothetical protein [Yinghuangia sp. ASG 101]UGQ14004.1 hypothetical protein LO772_10600 [Yinghuangia sp. ASG 101]